MEPSTDDVDLAKAIRELDELSSTLQRNEAKGQFARAGRRNLAYDDSDYATPRPASGFQNEVPRSNVSTLSQLTSPPDIASGSAHGSHYSRSISYTSSKSPTSTIRSEISSGFGTLPSHRVLGSPTEPTFPAPPSFAPTPPFPIPPSDSDYDDVASEDSDEFVYKHPTKHNERKVSSTSSSDYAEVDDGDQETVNVIKVNTITSQDDDMPDYDEVYSVPTSARNSTIVTSVNETIAANVAEKTPMVSEMKQISYSPEQQEDQKQREMEETSFMNPQINQGRGSTLKRKDEIMPSCDVTEHPVDGHSNKASDFDSSETDQTSGINSKYSTARRMDPEAQRKSRKERKDCPCECRAAVPLMTVAVSLCLVAFMLLTIAYVYFGLQNDEYRKTIQDDIDSSSGQGSGGGI